MFVLVTRHAARILAATLSIALASSAVSAHPAEARAVGSSGLERAYSHNDYNRKHPLADALKDHFKSVEADVCLSKGKLLVAHDCSKSTLRRIFDRIRRRQPKTLESLYLKPLLSRVKANGGAVYRHDRDYFTLLIDMKSSDPSATYSALNAALRRYRPMLTGFGPTGLSAGAVTVTLSGHLPAPSDLLAPPDRLAAYDGRMVGLGLATDQTVVPMFSQKWPFGWKGDHSMPDDQRKRLRAIVQTAHATGQRVRFYDTQESQSHGGTKTCRVWQELLRARVDYINTDHLDQLRRFLELNDPQPTVPWVSWSQIRPRHPLRPRPARSPSCSPRSATGIRAERRSGRSST